MSVFPFLVLVYLSSNRCLGSRVVSPARLVVSLEIYKISGLANVFSLCFSLLGATKA